MKSNWDLIPKIFTDYDKIRVESKIEKVRYFNAILSEKVKLISFQPAKHFSKDFHWYPLHIEAEQNIFVMGCSIIRSCKRYYETDP